MGFVQRGAYSRGAYTFFLLVGHIPVELILLLSYRMSFRGQANSR